MFVWCSRAADRASRSNRGAAWRRPRHAGGSDLQAPRAGPAIPARPRRRPPCRPGPPRGGSVVAERLKRRTAGASPRHDGGLRRSDGRAGLLISISAGNSSRICSASSGWAAVNSVRDGRSPARNRPHRNDSASSSRGSRSEPESTMVRAPTGRLVPRPGSPSIVTGPERIACWPLTWTGPGPGPPDHVEGMTRPWSRRSMRHGEHPPSRSRSRSKRARHASA